MFNVNFNLIVTDNFFVFWFVTDNRKGCPYGCANISISFQPKNVIFQRQSHGGSKPPPYAVELNFKVNTRLLSNLMIYVRP